MDLNVFEESNINKVISIVNNSVYHGNNESTHEIDSKLKEQLKTMFTDFFGEKHKDIISGKIDNMQINRCYHIWGPRNSISQFLLDEKARTFNENKKYPIHNPETLFYYVNCNSIAEEYNASLSNSGIKDRLWLLCDDLGVDYDKLNSPNAQKTLEERVQRAYQEYMATPFCRDPEKNNQMLYLNDYVNSYKYLIIDSYKQKGFPVGEYFTDMHVISELDPVYRKLTEHMNKWEREDNAKDFFDSNGSTAAFEMHGDIYLGINPPGSVIIHECFHSVAYNRETEHTGIFMGDGYRFFNEAITEYYSQMIHNKYVSIHGADLTTCNTDLVSAYEDALFKHMLPFMKTYSPEFRATLMRPNPVEDMESIVGKETFDLIASGCDTIYRLGYDANCKLIEKSLPDAEKELANTTTSSRNKKPPLERVINAISRNAEVVANGIKKLNMPPLQKLAGAIYSMTGRINQFTQEGVDRRLDEGARNNQLFNIGRTNTTMPEMDDDEMVMGK